ADAVAARDLRLEALRTVPENFGASWEEEAVEPLAWWEARLRGYACWLGAEGHGELAGLTGGSLNQRIKRGDLGEIGAVFVRERFRRHGVGASLMQSAMEWLQERRAINATLTVSASNPGARRLYERFGFVTCGQLQRELNVDGSFFDELLMQK